MHKLDGGETGLYYCSSVNQAQVLEAVQHPFNELLVSPSAASQWSAGRTPDSRRLPGGEEWGGSGRSLQVLTTYLATTNLQIPKWCICDAYEDAHTSLSASLEVLKWTRGRTRLQVGQFITQLLPWSWGMGRIWFKTLLSGELPCASGPMHLEKSFLKD